MEINQQQWHQAYNTERALLSTVSAFRRLPAEIIAAIMTQAVRCDPNFSPPSAERFAFQRWRRTAFSTPSLWRRLDVDLRGFFRGNLDETKTNFTRALNSWFSRAGEGASLMLLVNDFGSNRSPHQKATSTAEMDLTIDDLLEWMRDSHFKISHLDLFHVTRDPYDVRALCISKTDIAWAWAWGAYA
ncbi:hypothetical protein BKA70DRAFT_1479667 [Coprinopsis sp. MPI-PUGE-AT-0042]|nr:hypothetical protein BKA70DRAFT_1479667 [Coprinopsis sp. MPI-PUGE-AT-0042]